MFGFVLSPLSGLLVSFSFGVYCLIRKFWNADVLVIKILAISSLLFVVLGYFVTGRPYLFQFLVSLWYSFWNWQWNLENLVVLFVKWLTSISDFWAWSLLNFWIIGMIKNLKSHQEVMLERESPRLADRFTDDYTPDYMATQHQLVLGTTGAGKTSFLNEMARCSLIGISEQPRKSDVLIIVDGKADTGEHSLLDNALKLGEELGREVVVLNTTSNPKYDGFTYNPFESCDAQAAAELVMTLLGDDTVKKSSGSEHYKAMFEAYLLAVLRLMKLLDLQFSFPNIMMALDFVQMEQDWLVLRDNDNLVLSAEQLSEFDDLFGEVRSNWQDSKASVTKLQTFMRGRGQAIFGGENWFDVASVVKNNQILVVLIDEMSIPEYAQGIAKMVVQDVRNLVSVRLNDNRRRKKQIRLVLDEFSAYANKTMLSLLSRSRSANVTLYLSTQGFGDLSELGEGFTNSVVDNTNRFVVFRQNSAESAEKVADIAGTVETVTRTERSSMGQSTEESSNTLAHEYRLNPSEIKDLPNHTAFYIIKGEHGTEVHRFMNEWKKPVKRGFLDIFKQKVV